MSRRACRAAALGLRGALAAPAHVHAGHLRHQLPQRRLNGSELHVKLRESQVLAYPVSKDSQREGQDQQELQRAIKPRPPPACPYQGREEGARILKYQTKTCMVNVGHSVLT